MHIYNPEVKSMKKSIEGFTITTGVWRWRKKGNKRERKTERKEKRQTVIKVSQHV